MYETVFAVLALGIPLAIGVGKAFIDQRKCLIKQDSRSLRQSKALIILAHKLDTTNEFQHPTNNKLNLGPEIETILRDEHGNL